MAPLGLSVPVPMLDLSVPHVEEAQIQIDALATDPAWDGALVLDDFTAFDPVPGAAPTGRTTVRGVAPTTAQRARPPAQARVRAARIRRAQAARAARMQR